MRMQDGFNFRRIDILAAGDNHIFGAPDDVIVAILILSREVACIKPAVAERSVSRFDVLPVARADVTAAQYEFADASALNVAPFVAPRCESLENR